MSDAALVQHPNKDDTDQDAPSETPISNFTVTPKPIGRMLGCSPETARQAHLRGIDVIVRELRRRSLLPGRSEARADMEAL